MSRFTLVLPALFLITLALSAQQTSPTKTPPAVVSYASIPVEAAKQPNPVPASPESLARARKWFGMDCTMCHGKEGDGKGETARDMKLTMVDFTDPNTLKDRTDGEVNYIIRNGHQDMPPEGQRITTQEGWDLVNYVRSFSKKANADQKPADAGQKAQ